MAKEAHVANWDFVCHIGRWHYAYQVASSSEDIFAGRCHKTKRFLNFSAPEQIQATIG
jgi:hypothetical protein